MKNKLIIKGLVLGTVFLFTMTSIPVLGAIEVNKTSMNSSAGCCFPAGTRITMSDGSYKNIENVRIGDRVLSYDLQHDRFSSWTVKMLGRPLHPVYTINDGLIQMTKDHPLYVKKADGRLGWGAVTPDNDMARLRENILPLELGDQLFLSDGKWITITKITGGSEPVQTYNLWSILGVQTYFANRVLVLEEHPPVLYMMHWYLGNFFERFPHAFPILRQLLRY